MAPRVVENPQAWNLKKFVCSCSLPCHGQTPQILKPLPQENESLGEDIIAMPLFLLLTSFKVIKLWIIKREWIVEEQG